MLEIKKGKDNIFALFSGIWLLFFSSSTIIMTIFFPLF